MNVPRQLLRVLLGDDHSLVRAALHAGLRAAFSGLSGVQIVEAGCAPEAPAALTRHGDSKR